MTDQARAEGRLGPLNARPLLETAAAVLLCLLAFAASPPAAWAADGSAMVIDANTGKVLYDDAGDAARYPASLTKMMTLYLTFELIEKERLKFDDKITISAQAAAQPPSKLDLDAGDTISVRNAVLSLVTKSANDIAVALAEHIAGSEANFARLMTRKAREIGMSKTTFRNASGLPDGEQVTTARDMLTLALRLQDEFPEHYKLFATGQFRYAGHNYRNHNTLRSYRGTDCTPPHRRVRFQPRHVGASQRQASGRGRVRRPVRRQPQRSYARNPRPLLHQGREPPYTTAPRSAAAHRRCASSRTAYSSSKCAGAERAAAFAERCPRRTGCAVQSPGGRSCRSPSGNSTPSSDDRTKIACAICRRCRTRWRGEHAMLLHWPSRITVVRQRPRSIAEPIASHAQRPLPTPAC
ncbi:MAG: D-alanyl-D-alanine carboxypeptidase [Hyphomicrobiaceae bacterium]|nr:D-alanyl-D-alanine carboxypeptidase [Hyphomicrobiaceae bacterium]